jgi:hypothetical protein
MHGYTTAAGWFTGRAAKAINTSPGTRARPVPPRTREGDPTAVAVPARTCGRGRVLHPNCLLSEFRQRLDEWPGR